MKKLLLSFLVIFCLMAQANAQNEKAKRFRLSSGFRASADYEPDKIIFKLKEHVAEGFKVSSPENLIRLKTARVKAVKGKFPEARLKKNTASVLKKAEQFGLDRIYELTFSDGKGIEEVINEMLQNEDVEYAEPAYIYHTSYIPSDPGYQNNLMAYLNQVKAPEAWNLVRNSSQPVILAIVDSGSDLDHPDLAANIYLNTADPVNGIDDDRDGYVDNYWGWDFVGATATAAEDNNPNVSRQANDHGVHVSGIASAVSDNNKGVASIAFNTAKLMIVKVGPDDNGTDILKGYEGIKYAADHGASIINCSWGGEGASFYGQDVVNYAISKGCLIVAAAGNSSSSVPQYPAGYQGVLAVANVQSDDSRNSSSNFGYYVSISAPGSNIYSTTYNDNYGYKSGTSMATPVVASAAALVKAYLPHLNMLQVGEQLRSTADNIDQKNPAYINQLGKGRLNVYRALTESPPSIKKQALTVTDKNSGTLSLGDTISIYVDLKNFLAPVNALQVTVSSSSSLVTVTEAQRSVAFIGTMATANAVGPFKVYVKPGTPDNTPVEFRLTYSANNNTYTDFEGFVVVVARDYLNVSTSTIATTVTSIGKIGYLEPGEDTGTLGFQYKAQQLLYESALMIGNSSTRVSDNARASENGSNNHFVRKVRIQPQNSTSSFDAKAEFDDSNAPNPLNIHVRQRSYVPRTSGRDNYLIVEYEILNKASSSLSNLFAGLFNDWDINGGSNNVTAYDSPNKIAYVFEKNAARPYGGIKLLSAGSPAYYPLSNQLSGNILANDEFTQVEKFETLSSGVKSPGLGAAYPNGLDVQFVAGYGPYSIPPNGSIKVAFAFIGADNLDELKATSAEAHTIYNSLTPDDSSEIAELSIASYPNPVLNSGTERVMLSLPESGHVKLSLYNMAGQKVMDIRNESLAKGAHTILVDHIRQLSSGVYFYRLEVGGKVKTHKITVL